MITVETEMEQKLMIGLNASLEKKAKDITVMKITDISSFADYFIICSGTSSRQTQAIAAAIQEMMKQAGHLPRGVEGEAAGAWILLDYHDVVIHVFYEPVRGFYDLEGLWSEATVIRIDDNAVSSKALSGEKAF